MKYILEAKHWQLVAVLLLPRLIPSVTPLINSMIGILVFSILLSWLWGIGVVLNDKYDFTLSNGSFKVALLFFICYLFAFQLLVSYKPDLIKSNWIFLPHIFAILCLLYCFLFCARTLKAIESGGQASSSDCWGYFFLLFVFPIGIWIIQPKINRMYNGSFSSESKTYSEDYSPNPTYRRAVNLLVGLGILVFLIGLILGNSLNTNFKILIPIGTSSCVFGTLLFIFTTNLKKEFQYNGGDSLRYFWDKIVLKFWTLTILFLMYQINKEMFF